MNDIHTRSSPGFFSSEQNIFIELFGILNASHICQYQRIERGKSGNGCIKMKMEKVMRTAKIKQMTPVFHLPIYTYVTGSDDKGGDQRCKVRTLSFRSVSMA
jgi:hypothetical protein